MQASIGLPQFSQVTSSALTAIPADIPLIS
jgi:hypothetical protein